MRLVALSLVTIVAMTGLVSCVGTPPIERVVAEINATGACEKLPEGVTCECVTTTAHSLIPTIVVERSKDDTGSRLGRGAVGMTDPRVGVAIDAAKQSCAAGKAVG